MKYLKLLWNLFGLKRNTKKNSEQIRKLQEEKLRNLLWFAWNHSTFYRRTFEAAGITEETIWTIPLSDFPTIDKGQLLQNFDELITVSDVTQEEIRRFDAEEETSREPFKGKYHVVHSSGSTGKPGYFLYDEKAWNTMLLGIIRGALWDMSMPEILKLLAHGPRIVYIAATDGRYGGAMTVGDGIDGVGGKQLYLDINLPLTEWIRQLREFQPNIVIGYPSAMKIMAELLEQGQVEATLVRAVSCGEPLGRSLRHYLEEQFHTPIINIYGASESLALGVEVDTKEGMILFDDLNVVEVENGKMYLTCLYNFAQPLIRYQITDDLTLKQPEENSRFPFTKAVGLLGRQEDLLWFEDGDGNREFLHPLAIEGFCIEGLMDYQFRQVEKDTFEMLAEISDTALEDEIRGEMLRQMKTILNEKGLKFVQFYVRFVEEIRPNPRTGKKQLIVGTDEKERMAG
ncbi:MAG: phenylacetate--CoA ligase family protein [Roseburia sp.]|nr:phenylacetate--CoA ligase family protein [Roseburia sp.]